MKRVEAILLAALLAALAISLTGCVLGGKQPAPQPTPPAPQPAPQPPPPPAPQQLSMPQTQVTLPPPQLVNPEALAAVPATKETPPVEEAPAPKPVVRRAPTPPANTPAQRTEPPVYAAPLQPPDGTERAPIQEIVPADEKKQLQQEAAEKRRQVKLILDRVKAQKLSKDQKNVVKRVESFVAQSDAKDSAGDMRLANALAERALVLARELQNGK